MRTGPQVLVFPAWRENPFLNLLALAPRTAGYRFLGATTHHSLLRQLDRLGRGDILHLHWTSPIVQFADTVASARSRLAAVLAALDAARARGVRVVWTLHNRLPHELNHREEEIALYRGIAERADAIHIMAPDTAAVVSDVVRLDPAKVRVIPHPSYEGIYDSGVDRVQARDAFGLGSADHGVLFLGQIRPYKGVDALVKAAAEVRRSDRELVLMLAGVVKDMSADEFTAHMPDDLRRVTHFSFVPDGDLAAWFRAADVAVFPYRAILNSGSVHLAATFRVPVILPDEPHLRAQFHGQRWVEFFDTARPEESIRDLLADPALFSGVGEADFAGFTDGLAPWQVSRRYRDLLDELSAR